MAVVHNLEAVSDVAVHWSGVMTIARTWAVCLACTAVIGLELRVLSLFFRDVRVAGSIMGGLAMGENIPLSVPQEEHTVYSFLVSSTMQDKNQSCLNRV